MKKIIFLTLLILCSLVGEARELTKSDWQHVLYPGAANIGLSQGLRAAGVKGETSDTIALGFTLGLNLGWEYYQFHHDGKSTLEDLELSIIGIATSYYINKAINQIFRGKKVMARKKKSEQPEPVFVRKFSEIAELLGCRVFIIPDPMSITADNRRFNREKKRPFDFVLVTPAAVWCIEAKAQYNKQEEHQVITENRMTAINPAGYWVIRKKVLKYETVYTVEKNGKTVRAFDNLADIVIFFK